MHPRLHHPGPPGPAQPTATRANGAAASPEPTRFDLGLQVEDQVQCGLFLVLPLKTPAQMPALLRAIGDVAPTVHAALRDLHYVHFARFVPAPDFSALYVVTEFDGDADAYDEAMESYLMDFVLTLGEVFDVMLDFVAGAPRLPVKQYPRDFITFVNQHNLRIPVWSAAPEVTVIDILARRRVL
jgi:hypothetical protein